MADEPFDPDAYLAKRTATPPPATAPAAAPAETFDPNAYLTKDLPDAEAELRARRTANPGGIDATLNRIFSGAVTGIPDLGIGLYNAGARALGYPGAQATPLGTQMIEAGGGGQMPENASVARKLLEGGASALIGGGAQAGGLAASTVAGALPKLAQAGGSLAATTVAPTLGAQFGGDAGASVAKYFGTDQETGALLGSLFGGTAGAAVPGAATRYSHNWYADRAKPNAPEIATAAENQGVRPTAGMLGNADIQARERTLSGQSGARPFIEQRRQDARNDIAAALDRAAEARGATTAEPTPGTLGHDVAEVARTGRDQLATESSQGQQDLMNRIGPRSSVDATGILAAMENIRQRTDPGTAAPIDARVGTLRQMLPRDPQTGGIISAEVPYERLKDWRTNLRERGQGYDPVPGRYAGEVYDAATGAMRDAGAAQGVPPNFFDTIQGRTARIMGEGGPHETLSRVAEGDPMAAYNYLRRGEQEPGRLRTLAATGQPGVPGVMGDYLRLMGNQTISNPNQGARGPANLATQIERMHPEALDVIADAQRPAVQDVATLARSLDYPPSQTGLTRSLGGQGEGLLNTALGTAALSQAAGAVGLPSWLGTLAGLGAKPATRYLQAQALQGPTAINALSGGAAPTVASMSDLLGAINAASAAQSQRPKRVYITGR